MLKLPNLVNIKLNKKQLIILICIIVAVVIVAVTVPCAVLLTNNTASVDIMVDGQAVEKCDIYSGGEQIQFSYNLDNKKFEEGTVEWSVACGEIDAQISDSGLFVSGLKVGTVKVKLAITYKGETASDEISVNISPRGLESIKIKTPAQTEFIEGQTFNTDGYIVEGFFANGTTAIVNGWQVENADKALSLDDAEVTVSYTENGITKQTQITINVVPKTLQSLKVTTPPQRLDYFEDETFSKKGMVVTAEYEYLSEIITDYTIDKSNVPLNKDDKCIVISYTENGITKTVRVEITVTRRVLTNILINRPADKIEYNEGEYFDFLGLEIVGQFSNSPDAVVNRWKHDKEEPLTLDDTTVIITYTESGLTKSISFEIVVNKVEYLENEVKEVIDTIAILPELNNLTIADEDSIRYAGDLYLALSSELREKVTNKAKLEALVDKLIELKADQPSDIEPSYSLAFSVYNDLIFDDISFEGYPTQYKNSDGIILLNTVVSLSASEQGYEFIKWIDEDGITVSTIENLKEDKNYFAVFELTNTVNLVFKDYKDKETILLTLNKCQRTDFDIVTNNVESKILNENHLLPIVYYVELQDGTVVEVENDIFNTDYNETIVIYTVAVATREIIMLPQYDAMLAWNYGFETDDGEKKSYNKDNLSDTNLIVPLNAKVTIYTLNPLIADIRIDGNDVGLIYPATSYSFNLEYGAGALEICFDYYAAERTVLTFVGVNTRIYTYQKDGWDGKLSKQDIEELAFVFDEDNKFYLTRYEINGHKLLFDDLKDYVFECDTKINVQRVENEFSIILNYSGGDFTFDGLVGKQSVAEAVKYVKTTILDECFEKLQVFSDESRTKSFTKEELLATNLVDDIFIYLAERVEFEIQLNSINWSSPSTIYVLDSNSDFDIITALSEPVYEGQIFKGWSLTENGEILSEIYLKTIIANFNNNITLYAVWEVDEMYVPPILVDYSDEAFVGTWTASYYNNHGVISAQLTLQEDGNYFYEINVNEEVSVSLYGLYLLSEGKIQIRSLTMRSDYQLISSKDLTIGIEWVSDNIIIATAFIINDLTISSYDHYLSNGNIKPANYLTSDLLGMYSLTNKTVGENFENEITINIKLLVNGTASLEIIIKNGDDCLTNFTENILYRITSDGRLWIISYGTLGTMDFTNAFSEMINQIGGENEQEAQNV